MHPWKCMTAVGDSFSEGVGDPAEGIALKSSIDHIAEAFKHYRPEMVYQNFAQRGLLVREVRENQLDKALALQPDFISIIAGANDALRGVWNADNYESELQILLEPFKAIGTTIFMATWPDWSRRLPLSESHAARLRSRLQEGNAVTRRLAEAYGAIFLDVWDHPIGNDSKFWSKDHIHPNSLGYQAYAHLALEVIESTTGFTVTGML